MPKVIIEIELDVYNSVEEREMVEFIQSSILSGGGSRHPDDPMFDNAFDVDVTKVEYEN